MLGISLRTCFLISLIIAIIFSIYVANIAIAHNPMEEYCQYISEMECDIVWINLVPLLLIWFSVIFFSILIALIFFRIIVQKIFNK